MMDGSKVRARLSVFAEEHEDISFVCVPGHGAMVLERSGSDVVAVVAEVTMETEHVVRGLYADDRHQEVSPTYILDDDDSLDRFLGMFLEVSRLFMALRSTGHDIRFQEERA